MNRFLKGFSFAFRGLKLALAQLNFKVQLICLLLVIVAATMLNIRRTEWAVLLVCSGCVLGAESMNTAVEELTNLVSPGFNPVAGKVKDLSAAAVLIICITSVIVAAIIIGPKLIEKMIFYIG